MVGTTGSAGVSVGTTGGGAGVWVGTTGGGSVGSAVGAGGAVGICSAISVGAGAIVGAGTSVGATGVSALRVATTSALSKAASCGMGVP